jgi:DNA repair protein RecN (Recombination protein N)
MLLQLRLKDFVIVRELQVDFDRGFTVLTGETGAGKSILIDALNLILGGRGDASVVRESATKADLSALFETPQIAQQWLSERELTADEGVVWLRRVIDQEGRSKAFINGTPTTVQALRELAAMLIDIHGQHANLWLTKSESQRQLLDDHAKDKTLAKSVNEAFSKWRDTNKRLTDAQSASRLQTLERERLEWLDTELSTLAAKEGEWQLLTEDHKRLANAANLIEGAQAANDALTQRDSSIVSEVEQLASKLQSLLATDPRLTDAWQFLNEASIQLKEAGDALENYAKHIDLDPQRLASLDDRIGLLHSAARKFKVAPDTLAAFTEQNTNALAQLRDSQDIEALQKLLEQHQTEFDKLAKKLSTQRKASAKLIAQQASEHVQGLGMAGATLQISVNPAPAGPSGADQVEFLISQHASLSPRPLAKIASGGELSRVSLALAVAAADANPVPTIIFDEADAGVGGAVAQLIGQLMRTLGAKRQVLCVTHLPQVAALAHHHHQVKKSNDKQGVASEITALDKNARIDELARMLGGVDITATTRKHARELLSNVT